jgi:hypothetical protein
MVQLMKKTNSGSVRLGAARSVVELSTKVRETATWRSGSLSWSSGWTNSPTRNGRGSVGD